MGSVLYSMHPNVYWKVFVPLNHRSLAPRVLAWEGGPEGATI